METTATATPVAPKKTGNISVAIKSIEFDRNQNLVIVCQPNEHNEKGSYVMNAAQEERLLQRAGISDALTLKHLVSFANGTAKLNYVCTFNKAGDVWDNGLKGAAHKTDTFKKDWYNLSNHEIDLGFIAKAKITEAALASMFSQRTARRQAAPIATPVAVEVASTAATNDNGQTGTQEEETNV